MQIKDEASNAMSSLGLVSEGSGVSVDAQAIARFQPRAIMPKLIFDCEARVQALLVWNRAYKNQALMNFVVVARELVRKDRP